MPILFITVVIDLIGFGIVIPILPFIAPELGADEMDIALLIASHSILAGLCGPFWGKLSDKIGRKPVLLICLGGAAFAYLLLAMSTALWMVYVARLVAGAMSGNFGVASAMVADMSKPEERAKFMGIIGAAFGVGMVIGPFLGGVLGGEKASFFLPGIVSMCLSLTAMLAGLLFLKETLTPELRKENTITRDSAPAQSLWQIVRGSGNVLLVFQYFIQNSTHSTVSYLFPLWVGLYLGWGAREVGMVFGVMGLMMAILQAGLIGRIVDLLGELGVLAVGTCLTIIGFLVAAFATGETTILIGFFSVITGATLCTPVLNSLVSKRTAFIHRGRIMGTTSSMSAWGRMCGPIMAGVLLSIFGYQIAWLGGLLFCLWSASWVASEIHHAKKQTVELM